MYIYVCVYIYIYIYIYTHTHTCILPSKGILLEFDKVKCNTQKMQNSKITIVI